MQLRMQLAERQGQAVRAERPDQKVM
jgi:hypothetical protein